MIDAKLNQGIIQLSDTEFLPAHVAEKTLRSRIRSRKTSIGIGLMGLATSTLAAGVFFADAATARFAPNHAYSQTYIDIAGTLGLGFTSMAMLYSAYVGTNISSVNRNKLKLAHVQNVLGTAPIRR